MGSNPVDPVYEGIMRYLIWIFVLAGPLMRSGFSQTQIAIPDTLSGNVFQLNLHRDSVQFLPGRKTQTLGYNQFPYLGPTLILKKGQSVSLLVNNQMGDTTNVHWHGLHVSAGNDGGPHTMVMPGDSWNPQFTVRNNSSTFWYHPHFHGKTAEQAIKGAAGFIIVRDSTEESLALPKQYGVDDFPLVIQSAQLDNANQFMPRGMEDSLLFVNGTKANQGSLAELSIPAQFVRLRLLNGSGERTFLFGLSGNRTFLVIASDGGFLTSPISATRLRISPGERYQILIDARELQGQTIELKSYASELPVGVQGGPTMPMPPGSPPMDSPLNGVDFRILQLNVVAQTANPILTIPSVLTTMNPITESAATSSRLIRFTAKNDSVMDGPFFFNDSLFHMERIDYRIPINSVEIWELQNKTMVSHPFHIHLVQFNILDRDGNLPLPIERGWKDVVMVESQETVRLIARYETFADSMMPYMFHCHILMHEDDGMMGQFVVLPEVTAGNLPIEGMNKEWMIYPNPAGNELHFNVTSNGQVGDGEITILNTLGQLVKRENLSATQTISTAGWSPGLYQILVTTAKKTFNQTFIKH